MKSKTLLLFALIFVNVTYSQQYKMIFKSKEHHLQKATSNSEYWKTGNIRLSYDTTTNNYSTVMDTATFSYDAQGNVLNENYYKLVNNSYELFQQKNNTYNNANKLIQQEILFRFNQQLQNYSKDKYTYDNNQIETSKTNYYWQTSTNSWIPNFKHNDTIVNSDSIDTYYNWDNTLASWVPYNRVTLKLNTNHLITQALHARYINSNWVNIELDDSVVFHQNNNKFPEYVIIYLRDTINHVWTLDAKIQSNYTAFDSIQNTYYYETNANAWDLKAQINFLYNSNHALTSDTMYEINNGVYSIDNLDVYNYNPDNTISNTYYQNFYNGTIAGTRNAYVYDANQNIIRDSVTNYDFSLSAFTKGYVVHNYYGPFELGLKQLTSKNMGSVYPNPTKDNLNVYLKGNPMSATITLFDMMGNEVLSDKINNLNTNYNIQHLTNGLYFLEIENAGKVQYIKVVKE